MACCCSVTKSCPFLCDPMDCSMPGFPVLHHLPEFAQTHVHCINDAIQTSHPLSPLLLLPSVFPSIRVFSNEWALHIRWPKCWSFSFSLSASNVRHRNVPLWMFFKDCFKSRRWEYLYVPDSSKGQTWSQIPFKKRTMISIT